MSNECSSCCKDQNEEREAVVFCIECDEYFCLTCKQLHNRQPPLKNHSVIPYPSIASFPLELVNRSILCDCNAANSVEYYCRNHCSSFCFDCLKKKHRSCDSDNLTSMSKNVKFSSLFIDLQERIDNMCESSKTLRMCKTQNLQDLLGQTMKIEVELSSLLNRINCAFLKIINDSKKVFAEEYKKIRFETEEIKNKENELHKRKEEFDQISKFCSDSKIFLSISEIDKLFQTMEQENDKCRPEGSMVEIKISNKDKINTIVQEVEDINVHIEYKIAKKETNVLSPAQLTLPIALASHRTNEPAFSFLRSFDIYQKDVQDTNVNDCIAFNDGLIVAVDQRPRLLEFTLNGKQQRNVTIPSKSASCIAAIDQHKFAVTVHENVIVYDRKSLNVLNQIPIRDQCWGISKFSDNNFLVGCQNAGLILIGNSGKKEKVFQIKELVHSQEDIYINCLDQEILCSLPKRDSVITYDRNGRKRFEIKNKTLKGPNGITFDCNKNVFIAGFNSNNISWTTSNGTQCKEILNEKDGIKNPRGIFYNNALDMFVVCNYNGRRISIFKSSSGQSST